MHQYMRIEQINQTNTSKELINVAQETLTYDLKHKPCEISGLMCLVCWVTLYDSNLKYAEHLAQKTQTHKTQTYHWKIKESSLWRDICKNSVLYLYHNVWLASSKGYGPNYQCTICWVGCTRNLMPSIEWNHHHNFNLFRLLQSQLSTMVLSVQAYMVPKQTSNTFVQWCRSLAMISAPHNSNCGIVTCLMGDTLVLATVVLYHQWTQTAMYTEIQYIRKDQLQNRCWSINM